jgi:hypothetical protein
MTPLPKPLFGLTVLMLAVRLPVQAQDPCAGRVDWSGRVPSGEPNCVARLTGLESGPTEKEFKNAAECVRERPEKRARRMADLAAKNGCVAETLMQYEERLAAAEDIEEVVRQAYDHYIINTPGPLGNNEGLDPLARALAYGRRLLQTEPDRATLEEWQNGPIFCLGPAAECELRTIGQMINLTRYGRIDVIPSTLFPFHADAEQYDPHNAMWFADMAELVYHDWAAPRNDPGPRPPSSWIRVSEQLDAWGYQRQWLEADNTEAFVARKDNHAIIAFRGTSNLLDVVTDLNALLVGYRGGGKVHRGFAKAPDTVWPKLKEAVNALPETDRVFVTGHSLGGALAQLAAYRIGLELGRRVQAVYGYGSPRVGDRKFAGRYSKRLGDRTFLYVNGGDPVARVPTVPFYRPSRTHVGRFASTDHKFEFHGLQSKREGEARGLWSSLLEEAKKALERATTYLSGSPEDEIPLSYSPAAPFDESIGGYHRISQYLFKFACLNTEIRYQSIRSRSD